MSQGIREEPPGFKDWPAVLDRYGVQYLVLDIREDGDLLQCFRALPQWGVDLSDGASVLLARSAMGSRTSGLAHSG